MIVDRFHHLDSARELGVRVQSDQGSPLIADVGPLTRCTGGIVEGILQIVITLTPDQT